MHVHACIGMCVVCIYVYVSDALMKVTSSPSYNNYDIMTGLISNPCGPDGKVSVYNVGDLGSIPGSGRFLGERNSYPLQSSYLENSTDRGAWWAIVHGVAKSRTPLIY